MNDVKMSMKGRNPNSLKNLKPAKKGEVRNPNGGRTHSAEMKAMRKFSAKVLAEVIEAAVMGNLSDLKRIAEDPTTPAIQVGVATVLYKGIKNGDWDIVEKVLARVIGKVPDKIDHTTDGKPLNQSIAIQFVDDGTKD